jgi:hypothetical protein
MIITVCRQGSPDSFHSMLTAMTENKQVQAVMILACDANGFTPEIIDPWLQECRVPVFGGIFPQIITGGANLEKGTILAGLSDPVTCAGFSGLSDDRMDFDGEVEKRLDGVDLTDKTVFVFVDGLSSRISAFIEGLFNNMGLVPNYIGGGAGSLSFEQKPCIFTNDGLIMDGAVLGVASTPSGIGVAHGWHPISQALKVTEARKNRVVSLNWEPAFEVYSQVVSRHAGISFSDHPFFDIAKAYPLGIVKLDSEMVVRDPILTEDGQLVCVGEVPENSFVYILNGDIHSLIQGAIESRRAAEANFKGDSGQSVLFFIDCISRVLFMEDKFQDELNAVQQNHPTFGALTIGEIANTGDAYLEFYNKTAVSGILGDPCDA